MELQASTLIEERFKKLLQWPRAGRAGSESSPAESGTAVEHPDPTQLHWAHLWLWRRIHRRKEPRRNSEKRGRKSDAGVV